MRAAALDDGVIDRGTGRGPAATVEDHAGAAVGLEALLEVVEEGGLGRGHDDEIAEVSRFRVQVSASQML